MTGVQTCALPISEHGWLHGFLAPVAGVAGGHETSVATTLLLMGTATGIALLGWGLAHFLYSLSPSTADNWAGKFQGAYNTLLNKYFVDELYDFLFVEPTKRIGEFLDWFDRTVIDGLVNGVAQMAEWGSAGSTWIEKYVVYAGLNVIGFGNHLAARQGRKLQSGMVHHYAAIIIAGLFLLALVVQLILQM